MDKKSNPKESIVDMDGAVVKRDESFMPGHNLARLAQQIDPVGSLEDIVLPDEAMSQLREICGRVTHRQQVLHEWGFGEKFTRVKGTEVLFTGTSGTGKTMSALAIANTLNLDIYRVDLAGVISKYIGETEKNLGRIFSAAMNSNSILYFDEADALFGKRTEVSGAQGGFSNFAVSYLLHKLKSYEGLSIVSTNTDQPLDQAFLRRMAFTVHFPFPDSRSRLRIWQSIWPVQTPLAGDLDLVFLAQHFQLSGGEIKNVALAAAFLAAESEEAVRMNHLLLAARREYQKMGKTLPESKLFDS